MKIAKKLVFSGFAVVATLILLEVGVRTVDLVQGHGLFRTRGNLLARPAPNPVPFRIFGFDPYIIDGNETRISDRWQREFALQKPAKTYRIVCFGGSTTDQRVDGEDYPALLQAKLRERHNADNIEVLNVGNSAYATPHSLMMLLLDVVSWQPDVVILSHNINDLTVMYWPGFRIDYWNKYTDRFYMGKAARQRRDTWNNILFQHSRLYWFAYHRIEASRIARKAPTSDSIRRREYDDTEFQQAAMVFRRNLTSFVNAAQQNEIRAVLATQPFETSEEYFLKPTIHKPYLDKVTYPTHAQFVQHHAAYNRIIRDVAQELEVQLVDNEKSFAGVTEHFIDHVHYTGPGLDKLAQNFANALSETTAASSRR